MGSHEGHRCYRFLTHGCSLPIPALLGLLMELTRDDGCGFSSVVFDQV